MREQLLDRYLLAALTFEFGDVNGHGVAESNLAALDEYHHARRRGDYLRQTREVEDCVRGHRLAPRHNRARAVSLAPHDAAAARDKHDRARQLLPRDGVVHGGVNEREPPRVDRDLRGLHRR